MSPKKQKKNRKRTLQHNVLEERKASYSLSILQGKENTLTPALSSLSM